MENLNFDAAIPLENLWEIDSISFGYHINTFDYPRMHTHKDFWEFTIVTEGTIENKLNGKSYICPKNSLFFATTKDAHCLVKKDNKKVRYINLTAKEGALLKIIDAISPTFKDKLINGSHCFSIPENIIINVESIIHRANISFGYKRGYNDLICSAVLLVLQYLFSQNIDAEEGKPTFETIVYGLSLKESFLSFSVSDLCRELNYSRVQLNRLFKKYFDMTPHEYLIERKLGYAKSLLVGTTMSSSEIASIIGFSNLSQFNIDFKKKFGITPGAYRKQDK